MRSGADEEHLGTVTLLRWAVGHRAIDPYWSISIGYGRQQAKAIAFAFLVSWRGCTVEDMRRHLAFLSLPVVALWACSASRAPALLQAGPDIASCPLHLKF